MARAPLPPASGPVPAEVQAASDLPLPPAMERPTAAGEAPSEPTRAEPTPGLGTPPPAAALIEFRNVSRRYGEGEAEVRALDEVNLTIAQGEFVAIMGPSGSGKSTSMNIIGCLDRPSSGAYLFAGTDVSDLSGDALALLRRHYLGFVFQGFNLLARTTARENVELPLIYKGLPAAERVAAANSALARVGLAGREQHDPSQLSGGQQQRVAIARALAGSPTVILADEPTGNLDSQRSHEILTLLQKLNRDEGITIVMVTHEADIAAYAKRLLVFTDGKITRDEAVVAPAEAAEGYDGPTGAQAVTGGAA